jgi:hypothetical protein
MDKFSKLEAMFTEVNASEQDKTNGGWSKKSRAAWCTIANAFEGVYSSTWPR